MVTAEESIYFDARKIKLLHGDSNDDKTLIKIVTEQDYQDYLRDCIQLGKKPVGKVCETTFVEHCRSCPYRSPLRGETLDDY